MNSQVLTKVHKYDPVKLPSPFDFSMGVLGKSDLAPLDKGSMDFVQVESGGQSAPYWTASADGVGLPTSDLHVLRALEPFGNLHLLERTWCGFFADASHCIAFRLVGDACKVANVTPDQWYAGFTHYDDSSCIVWPVRIRCPSSAPFRVLEWLPVKACLLCFKLT